MNCESPETPPPTKNTLVTAVKLMALGVGFAACVAYGWRLGALGAFERIGSTLSIRTGDYYWQFAPSFGLIVQGIAALLFVIFMAMRRPRWADRPGAWGAFLTVWIALALALLLAYMQISGTRIILPFFTIMSVAIAGLGAYALARPGRATRPLQRLAGRLSDALACPTGQTLTLAALTALSLLMAWIACRTIYQGNPLVTDAQSQIAQARMLLAGQWRLEIAQGLRDVIAFPYATPTVPSFSQYPPGHILLLVPLLAMGLPAQMLNFAAGALTVLLAMRLAGRLFGPEATPVAGLLMVTSPFILMMNGGAMNHGLAAALLLATAFCLMPRAPGQTIGRKPWHAFAGGLCLGWAAATRPLTGLAHGLVWAGFALGLVLWGLYELRKKPSGSRSAPHPARTLAHGLLVTLGVAIPAAVFLFYNWKTTGDPLVLGYLANNPELHRLGFRPGGPYPYSPLDALNNFAANGLSLNALLLGWPIGSLVVLALWLLRTRLTLPERLLLALIAAQTGLYTLYHFHDLFLGPRFLFEIAPLLILLASGGLAAILKGRDFKAGLLWLLIPIMAIGGGIHGLNWTRAKHSPAIARHSAVERFLQATLPVTTDTVIVIREPAHEMIGRHFTPPTPGQPTLWFVPAKKEAQARKRPELQDFQWLYYPPNN